MFRPFKIADIPVIKTYFRYCSDPEYTSWVTMISWTTKNLYFYATKQFVLLALNKPRAGESFYVLRPLCKPEHLEKAIIWLSEHWRSQNITPVIEFVIEPYAKKLLADFPKLFEVKKLPFKDYIYETQKLATLAGRKLQKKRNLKNRFLRSYDHRIEKLTQKNILSAQYVFEKWAAANKDLEAGYHQDFNLVEAEFRLMKMFVDNYQCFADEIHGTIVFVNNEPAAFSISFANEKALMYETIIEKADSRIKGLYQFIMSENLLLHNVKLPYYNRQDAGASATLNATKNSYYPVKLVSRVDLIFK